MWIQTIQIGTPEISCVRVEVNPAKRGTPSHCEAKRLSTAVLSRGLYNHRKKRESESGGASQSHISASAVVV